MTDTQQLPHDMAAEQGVLGGVLAHGAELLAGIAFTLQAQDFYDRRHSTIFNAMVMLWDRGQPVDEITVTSYLTDQGKLEAVGGPVFLAALADLALAPAHVDHYARMVRDKARLRELVAACDAARHLALAPGVADTSAVLADAQERVNAVCRDNRSTGSLVSTADLLPRVLEDLEQRQEQHRDPRALSWGFADLDQATGGMLPGELVIPAGRPGMGKSSFMLAVAARVALYQGRPVLYVAREQPSAQMLSWLICSLCRVNTQAWRQGRLAPMEMRLVASRREHLARSPLFWHQVRGRGERALRSIEAQVRYLRGQSSRGGLALVVVDYLQLLARTQNDDAISEISQGLKSMAMDHEVVAMAASQLNREVERRDDKRPVLADLRGSGSLEQDADLVALLYRRAYYDPASEDRTVTLSLAKQRGGARAPVQLAFIPECVRFEDAQPAEPQGGLF